MTSGEPGKRAPRAWITLALLAVGLALFVWMIERLDLQWSDVRGSLVTVGWWFLAIFGLTLARFALRTKAWLAVARDPMPFVSALAATLSGDALGRVVPVGPVASEPAKAIYLRHHVSPATALASLAAENFFYSVSVALYVMIASAALVLEFDDLDPRVHMAGVVALASMGAVLAGAAWLAWQKPALASRLLERVPIGRVRALVSSVRVFEEETYGAAGHEGGRLAIVTVCEVLFHLLSLLECWLVFWLLTGVTAMTPALIYDGFNRVVNILFKWLPGQMGVEEGGTAILAGAIGYRPADGFMLAIVRKVRMIVFTAIGMALWARNSRRR